MAGEEMINLTRLGDYNNNMLRDAHILKRSTTYAVDDKVNKGLIYLKCTQAGITASTALSLSGVSVGDTLTDGTVTWKVISIKGVPEGGGTGAGLEDWESNHNYAVDDIYVYEGEIYKTLVKFTSGATEDSRTKVNDIVPSVWTANTAYTAGDIIEHTDVTTLKKVYYTVTDDFTSGATFEVTAQMQELQIVEEYVPNPLTKQQVKNLIDNFVPSGSGTDPIFYNDSPIGTIIAYMGTTAPKDYLACDNTIYNIADYKELAEYIKTQFGSYNYFGGDGITTFAVPDLRGEFLRGTGTNSHANQGSGANVGVHQDGTAIRAEWLNPNGTSSHEFYTNVEYQQALSSGYPSSVLNYDSVLFRDYIPSSTGVYERTLSSTMTDLGDKDFDLFQTVRPTNTSVLYCIKYTTSVLSTPENNYSTTEQRIGTWIDGKHLYRKVFENPTFPINAGLVSSSYGVKRLYGHGIVSGTSSLSIPYADRYTTVGLYNDLSSGTIGLNTTNSDTLVEYVVVEYTKTTD